MLFRIGKHRSDFLCRNYLPAEKTGIESADKLIAFLDTEARSQLVCSQATRDLLPKAATNDLQYQSLINVIHVPAAAAAARYTSDGRVAGHKPINASLVPAENPTAAVARGSDSATERAVTLLAVN